MGAAALQVLVILGLIVVNGMLAMSEIAIVAARKSRLEGSARAGDLHAASALALANQPTRFLSTVQIGITAIGILAGAFGGATFAGQLSTFLQSLGMAQRQADSVGIAVVVLSITFFSVVIGELVPKRLALHNPEGIARRVARPMQFVSKVAGPGVWVLSAATDGLLKLFGARAVPDPGISEEELVALIVQAAARGIIEPTEQQIVERLFRLSDRTVAELMTKRENIAYMDLQEGTGPDVQLLQRAPHPRYLLCRGGLDNVLGFVSVHDLMLEYLRDGRVQLERAVREPHWVGTDYPALRLLYLFQSSGIHIALVEDDQDRLRGMVTLTDLLENVVGELPDIHEIGRPRLVQRDDGSWLVDASIQLVTLRGALPREHRSRLEGIDETTVANLVLKHAAGRLRPAAVFHLNGVRFEILDMDGPRVDKVLVELPAEPLAAEPATRSPE